MLSRAPGRAASAPMAGKYFNAMATARPEFGIPTWMARVRAVTVS